MTIVASAPDATAPLSAVATQTPAPQADAARHRSRLRAVPRWWRDVTGGLAWLSVVFVVALWVSNGGLVGWADLGTALTSAGRLAGLVASLLILWQVLTMARVPMIEQAWGQDELSRVHRIIGFTSFNLMLGHIVLVILGYAELENAGFIATFVDETLHSPGMLLAVAGALALVMVVVTSVRKARARLRYESWHLLHLYAYLGAGLALPHQLWTGEDFTSSPAATVFWWGLYIAALASVLIWRVALPLLRSRRHALVVESVRLESPSVVTVTVTGRNLDRLRVRAGQFFQWRFLDGPGWTRGNPYSISASPTDTRLRFTAAVVGDSTSRLASLAPGTKVLLEGPYGRLHQGVRTREKSLLIGSGIGITPVRALLEDVQGDTVFVYRARSEAEMVLADEILELAERPGVRALAVVGNRIEGRDSWLPQSLAHLRDDEALLQIAPDLVERDIYVCGPVAWMDHVRAAALAAGVPSAQIHLERFTY